MRTARFNSAPPQYYSIGGWAFVKSTRNAEQRALVDSTTRQRIPSASALMLDFVYGAGKSAQATNGPPPLTKADTASG
jgi:hypothetical protein